MKSTILLLMCCLGLLVIGCNTQSILPVAPAPENTFSVHGSVHEMNLNPEAPPSFPEHEGKTEFMSYCSICHSLRYISTQPDFPAKTWDAEVTKMIAKYHAPIDSVVGKKIVGYLVAVKGKK